MKPIEVLNDKLKGNFISRFSIGDTWDLYFGDYWLSTHNLISSDESPLNEWLLANYPPFQKAIDQEDISKCVVVAAFMRKKVVSVALDDSCNLTINFEDNGKLILPTDTDIVDWQWSLSEGGNDPYMSYIVACFGEGQISIKEE
ncbi:hypothetical protein E4631_14655 [Hymenobacter sp. UV11]|uniref:hypothetical protein n=1 Tax=Hymenobacter sp. UV11 TaxID=1849735 RepID=UPI00105D5112|nr:hypothetical protein [Hymenobacter sp. UV11]TDN39438.1 hypothetical protein A8B98_19560 [Hymenobacter sp. UV11]TFZ65471.1 hypothetical protein E4631_14655 [Hymenobacter sp. UV11]